jgi:hypothetical protein
MGFLRGRLCGAMSILMAVPMAVPMAVAIEVRVSTLFVCLGESIKDAHACEIVRCLAMR